MTVMLELTVALLTAAGLLFLIWALFGRLLTPAGELGAPVFILIQGEGDGAGLEHTVNALLWLRGRELTACPILLVDAGLDQEGKAVAKLLLDRWPELRSCGPEEIAYHLN